MSYIISSRMLHTDYREEMIKKTLDLYRAGDDISESPLVTWGRKVVMRGDWWYGCEGEGKDGTEIEACLQNRQREVLKLYHSLLDHGYKNTPISVYFDKKTGEVHVYDGFHRLSIMKYLGLSADMNCVISHHHPDPNQRGDFPLAETLEVLNSGQNLYQPLNDPRVGGWNVWRPDSQIRLNILKDNLVPGSVVDVGCDTGYISRALVHAGHQVTALERSPKRLAVTRYMATIKNVVMDFLEGPWQHELRGRKFANILMMSVLHHDILAKGADQLKENLGILRGNCKRLIVEMPLKASGVKWLDDERKNLWSFTMPTFIKFLEEATEMSYLRAGIGLLKDRPLIVLEEVIM